MAGMLIRLQLSGISLKELMMPRMFTTSRRRYLRPHKSGITARQFFLSGFLVTGLALGCRAASVVSGYVQTTPTGVQPGNPNVTSITAGNVTDTALTAGGCVQASGTGLLSVTGISCGSGGGGSAGGGTINNANQYSSSYYSYTGSSNVISGLAAGTAGQYLTTQGSSGPPSWTTFVSTITAASLGALTTTSAASTYLTQTNAVATYETISGAAGTFLPFTGGTLTGTLNGPVFNSTNPYQMNGANILSSYPSTTNNTAVGGGALFSVPSGIQDTAVGNFASYSNTTGSENTAIGASALQDNSTGSEDDAHGWGALYFDTSGSENDAFGADALNANTSGNANGGFGILACVANTVGSDNLCLGALSNVGANNLTNAIAIGANSTVNASNTMQLGGTGTNAVTVNTSSANFSGAVQIAASGSLQMQNLAANQCVQTTGDGHISTAGFACGSGGGGNYIQNQNTLQSGATFYVSSGTIAGPLIVTGNETLGGSETIGNSLSIAGGTIYVSTNVNSPVFLSVNNYTGTPTSAGGWASAITASNVNEGANGSVAAYFQTSQSTAVYVSDTAGTGIVINGFGSPTALDILTGTILDPVFNTTSTSMTVTGSNGLAVTGAGNGQVTLTVSGSTYTVVASSVVPTVGQYAIWTSTNGTVGSSAVSGGGGTPGGSNGQLQYNNATAFGGVPFTAVTASSISFNAGYGVQMDSLTLATGAGGVGGVLNIWNSGNNNDAVDFWNDAGTSKQATIYLLSGTEWRFDDDTTGPLLLQTNDATRLSIAYGGNIGINESGLSNAQFGVMGATTNKYTEYLSTASTGGVFVAVSTNSHILSNGPTPVITSCGTGSPADVGDDHAGTITVGGGSVTACTLTFVVPYGSGCTVVCTTSDSITTATPDVVATNTGITFGFSASIGGGNINYICEGYGATCQ